MPGKLTPVLFAVAGVLWVGVMALGSGVLLSWPAVASFLSAGAFVKWPGARATAPLAAASGFLGLSVSLYQLAASANLNGSLLSSVAGYSAPLFAVFTVIYLVLIFLSLRSGGAASV